ncbi:oligosaccharide flippase family protein, partial [Porticoccaceae bacterium]|nr:oligosaccharide flippase family protein [Porticoccaceae bacterium]
MGKGAIDVLAKRELTDSMVYSSESIFSGLCSLLFYVLIANILDVKDIGAYALVTVYASCLASVANFGLVSGYERTYFEFTANLKQKGKLISSLQIFSFASILAFVVLGALFSQFLASHLLGDAGYARLWVLILCAVSISEFNKFYLTFLRNSRQAKLFAYLHITQVFINLSLGYLFLVIYDTSVESIGVSLLVSHLIVLVWMYIHQMRNLPLIVDSDTFRSVARLSLPLTPRVIAGFIGTQFDKIIISQVSTLDSLGVYSVAQRLAISINMLMNAVGRVWQPRLYEGLFEKGSKTSTHFLLEYMVISFIPALFLIVFSQEIFIFFPETYSSGFKILVVLCFYYLILYLSKITGQQLLFAKKTWLISGLSMLTILVNILVTYPLVIRYDALGAAVGTVIASLIMGLFS